MSLIDLNQHISLLQDGVGTARATLYAIEAADLFRALPADKSATEEHNHGCWLLGMLAEHLARIQEQVDALDGSSAASMAEG